MENNMQEVYERHRKYLQSIAATNIEKLKKRKLYYTIVSEVSTWGGMFVMMLAPLPWSFLGVIMYVRGVEFEQKIAKLKEEIRSELDKL